MGRLGHVDACWRWWSSPRSCGRSWARSRWAVGGALAWLTNTFASALLGLLVGAVVVAVMHLVARRRNPAVH